MNVRFLVICLNPTIQRTLVFSHVIPGQVNRAKHRWVHGSGKGVNTTRVLQQLEASVTHLTQVGGSTGEYFTELLQADGLSLVPLPITKGIRTCTTIIDESTGQVTELVEEGMSVEPNHEDFFLHTYDQLLKEHQFILLNGSKAPGFSPDIFPRLVKRAKEQSCQVFVDYRGADLLETVQYNPDWIKINLQECIATWFPHRDTLLEGSSDHLTQAELELLMDLHTTHNICFLITHGSQPALGIWNNQYRWFEIAPTKGVNPIGSGDSVFAGLAWAIAQGHDVAAAIEFGLDCGRRNYELMKPGSIL